MFRWISVIISAIAVVVLSLAGVSLGVWFASCYEFTMGFYEAPPPSAYCVRVSAASNWLFLTGASLTVLLLVVHLVLAAKQRKWGWFIGLLVAPIICFFVGIGVTASGNAIFTALALALIGLPNLLFGLIALTAPAEHKDFPTARAA